MILPQTPTTVEELQAIQKIQIVLNANAKTFTKINTKYKDVQLFQKITESYEICLNEIGFMLQQRDLIEYSALMLKIFVGMKQIMNVQWKKETQTTKNTEEDQPLYNFRTDHGSEFNQIHLMKNLPHNNAGRFGGTKLSALMNTQTDFRTSPNKNLSNGSGSEDMQKYTTVGSGQLTRNLFPNLKNLNTTANRNTQNTQGSLSDRDNQGSDKVILDYHQEELLQQVLKQQQKLQVQIVMKRYDPKIKIFLSTATDTNQDSIDAMKAFSKQSSDKIVNDLISETDLNILELQQTLNQKSDFMNKQCSGVVDKMKNISSNFQKKGLEFDLTLADAQQKLGSTVDTQMDEFVTYVQQSFHNIQHDTYLMIMNILKTKQKRKEQKDEENYNLQIQTPTMMKQTHREKNLQSVKATNQVSEKIANDLDEKSVELFQKQTKINNLAQKIKELQDTNQNTDLELDYMKAFQFRLEQDRTNLQFELRKMEKQLISSSSKPFQTDQQTQTSFTDTQLLFEQQQYQLQFLNNEVQIHLKTIHKLQDQMGSKNSNSQVDKSLNKTSSQKTLQKSDTQFIDQKSRNQDERSEKLIKNTNQNISIKKNQKDKKSSQKSNDSKQNSGQSPTNKEPLDIQVGLNKLANQKSSIFYQYPDSMASQSPKDSITSKQEQKQKQENITKQNSARQENSSRQELKNPDQYLHPTQKIQNIQKANSRSQLPRQINYARSSNFKNESQHSSKLINNDNQQKVVTKSQHESIDQDQQDSIRNRLIDHSIQQDELEVRQDMRQPGQMSQQTNKSNNYQNDQNWNFQSPSNKQIKQQLSQGETDSQLSRKQMNSNLILEGDEENRNEYQSSYKKKLTTNASGSGEIVDNETFVQYKTQSDDIKSTGQEGEQDGQKFQRKDNRRDTRRDKAKTTQIDGNEQLDQSFQVRIQSMEILCENVGCQTDDFLLLDKLQSIMAQMGLNPETQKILNNALQKFEAQIKSTRLNSNESEQRVNNRNEGSISKQLNFLSANKLKQNEEQQKADEMQKAKEFQKANEIQKAIEFQKAIELQLKQENEYFLMNVYGEQNEEDEEEATDFVRKYNNGKPLKQIQMQEIQTDAFVQQLYKQFQVRGHQAPIIALKNLIIKFHKKKQDEIILYDEFKEFFQKLSSIHRKCGDGCIHLRRFYMRLGFINQQYGNRRVLRPSKSQLKPFTKYDTPFIDRQQLHL